MDVYELEPDPTKPMFQVLTRCSDDHGQKPEQVHFMLTPTPSVAFVYRFKSPRTLNLLIDALIEHRNDVWGGIQEVT